MIIFAVKSYLKFISPITDHNVCRQCFVFASRKLCTPRKDIIKVEENPPSTAQQGPNNQMQGVKEATDFKVINSNTLNEHYLSYWFEYFAVRRTFKKNRFFRSINSSDDFLRELYTRFVFPRNWTEFIHWRKTKRLKKIILNQTFLPERMQILKPDLAAAHFIVFRKGRIKFKNQDHWVDLKQAWQSLPFKYIPGYEIEAIDAEGTCLRREGLDNISEIPNLKWLSLKGLIEMDDWCLDWVSNHFEGLEYLDISGCVNVTHRGLSCFCRFESLKTLIVEGVCDTPEFKVACLMLQDILPELKIGGIDLRIPDKIDPIADTETPKEKHGDVT